MLNKNCKFFVFPDVPLGAAFGATFTPDVAFISGIASDTA